MKFILCNYRIARKSRTFPIKIDCFSDLLFSLLFCSDLLFCDWYSIILAVILLWQLSGTAVILLQPGLLFCMWWLLIFLFTNLLFCSGVVFSFRDRCYIALTIFFYMSAVNFLLTCYFVCYTCYFAQNVIFLWLVILSITAVIFVVDSSNRDRLAESCNELAKLVQEKELKEASLLIFANKQVSHHFHGLFFSGSLIKQNS